MGPGRDPKSSYRIGGTGGKGEGSSDVFMNAFHAAQRESVFQSVTKYQSKVAV